MKYLTQLLHKRVVDSSGRQVGRIADVIASTAGRLPTLSGVILTTPDGERAIRWSDIEFDDDPAGPRGTGVINHDVRIVGDLGDRPGYAPGDTDLRLHRDVLDRQIVDVHGHRVVRVNDVRLAESGGDYCVVGVDSGARAILRRFGGVSKPVEAAFKAARHPLRSSLIAWDDVQTLGSGGVGGQIQLKVTHDRIGLLHPADIADIVEQLSPKQRAEVIEALDTETAADTIAETEPHVAAQIIQHLDTDTATDILEEMEPDEAADVLDDLPEERSDELLQQMEPDDAEEVKGLMAYDDDSAGGLMTTELVVIPASFTCQETIDRLRELAPKAETAYYVYISDDDSRLIGVLSLRDLVVSPPSTAITEIMVRNPIHVYLEDHADRVAHVMGRYSLLAVPVVDEEERLQGIITVDDTLERLLPAEARHRVPAPALEDSDSDDDDAIER